eukprot:gene3153-biopygen5850
MSPRTRVLSPSLQYSVLCSCLTLHCRHNDMRNGGGSPSHAGRSVSRSLLKRVFGSWRILVKAVQILEDDLVTMAKRDRPVENSATTAYNPKEIWYGAVENSFAFLISVMHTPPSLHFVGRGRAAECGRRWCANEAEACSRCDDGRCEGCH